MSGLKEVWNFMKISFGRSEYQGEGQAGEVGFFKPYKRKVYISLVLNTIFSEEEIK